MQPNYVNYYENYEINQRKPQMMAPMYHSTPHNPSPSLPESYYQQRGTAPNNLNPPPQTMNMLYSNRDANYYENVAKYPNPQNVQNVGPMYSSYNNPSPVMNSNNLVNSVPNNFNAPQSFNSFAGNATHNSHNLANMGGGNHFPARDREDASFFLQSFQNYFQEQGLYNNGSNGQRNLNTNSDFHDRQYGGPASHSLPLSNQYNSSTPPGYSHSGGPNMNNGKALNQNYYNKPTNTNVFPHQQPPQNYMHVNESYSAQKTGSISQGFKRTYDNHSRRNRESHERFHNNNSNYNRKHHHYKDYRRDFSSESSRSRSRSRSFDSRSPYVKRKTSESMKKNAAFKKMLKDKNNWECPNCRNLNFSKRIRCNRCHKSRPTKESVDTRKFVKNLGGPPGLFREGDWACSKCDNINFAKRLCCNRCGKEKDSNDVVGVIKSFTNSHKKRSGSRSPGNSKEISSKKYEKKDKSSEKFEKKDKNNVEQKDKSSEKLEKTDKSSEKHEKTDKSSEKQDKGSEKTDISVEKAENSVEKAENSVEKAENSVEKPENRVENSVEKIVESEKNEKTLEKNDYSPVPTKIESSEIKEEN